MLDGLVAFPAKAVCAVCKPFQRGIYFSQQTAQTGVLRHTSNRRFQASLSLFQLAVEKSYLLRGHSTLPKAQRNRTTRSFYSRSSWMCVQSESRLCPPWRSLDFLLDRLPLEHTAKVWSGCSTDRKLLFGS